jgi:hypothetical protein
MRSYLTLLSVLIAAISFSACKKDKIPVSDSLTGTWELSVDGGGWGPIIHHKPGNDTLAVFTATTYAFYDGKQLVKSGTYITKKDTSYLYNQLKNRIIFDGQSDDIHQFYDIGNNQLSFFIDANDAGSTTYRRIK